MPIKAEKRHLYPADWPAISQRIRERAGQKCEQCGAPNGQLIARGGGKDAGTYMLECGEVYDAETGEYRGLARGSEYEAARFVRVVLTVSHTDHDPANNDDGNLRALCQRCHLAHDRDEHARNAAETRRCKKHEPPGQGRLFDG